jgi:tripartite-type tricarboxylate transporter receptor subunit TctC
LIERTAKVRFNAIAYRGDGPVLADLLGGQVEFAALGVGTLSGKPARVLAVLSQKRHPALPDVPSVTELGFTANSQGLNGLYVPAGTPRPIVERYEAVCRTVTTSPAFADRARGMSQVISYLGAREYKAVIDSTYKVHENLVPDLKLEKN